MKKVYLAFLMVIMLSVPSIAQNTRTVSLQFAESEFQLDNCFDGVHINTTKYPTILQQDTLAPALPFVCVNILIGADEHFMGFNMDRTETQIYDRVEMAPNPIAVLNNGQYEHRSRDRVTFTLPSYPIVNIEYTGEHEINDYRFVTFLVCPFRYDTSNKQLYLNKRMDIEMQLSADVSKNNSFATTYNDDRRNFIKNFVVNPKDLDSLYSVSNNSSTSYIKAETTPYKYLIITSDSLKSEFQRLADWKTTKGVRAKVMTTEYIYNNYQARNNPLKIKTAIKDEYDTSGHALEYVLLGGLSMIVPAQDCYAETTSDGNQISSNNSADIFYACLTDLDWDKYPYNNKYGELSDSVDVTPNLIVTRLPVRNLNSARSIVNRILQYETNPDTCGWKNEILMTGVKLYYDTIINGVIQSDAHQTNELVYSQYINNTDWEGSHFRFYDTGTDNILQAGYNVTNENLQAEFSKGYSFAHVLTHGSVLSWSMEEGEDYSGSADLPGW